MTSPEDSSDHSDNLSEEDLIRAFDSMFLSMMRFTKKQILEESIHQSVITPPQFGLLCCLVHTGSQTMKELSERMDLTHGASTGLVDRLHKLGLVSRDRSSEDRRVVHVEITPEGQQLIQRIDQRRHAILRKIVSHLTPEERRLMLKIDSIVKEKLMNHVE
ncbi:MAG: hypothetical protein CVV27_07315 [Candidatus Melainabacteria bacterium HGW-Melainabacteria-1]|nr:MAG: hypothetical protein CVV27_07315 [Candidatus Melainabacteria bacterium HGW-Melainabacteria-1]